MVKIIEKHDNDKNYIFTCPVCGTVFTERERNIDNYGNEEYEKGEPPFRYILRCPNCDIRSKYLELKEYHEPPK